jgi:aminoglycoside phosphotransferase (APT) family kinase protein
MLMQIPEARREAVRHALHETFGVDLPDALSKMTAGLSGALVYRADVGGRPWLLRVETAAPSPFADPHRHYTALQRAAHAGVSPPVRFADPQSRIAIVHFIEPRPLMSYPGGAPAMAEELAQLIARLQGTPVFGAFTDYLDGIDGIIANMMGLGVVSEAAIAPYLAAWRELRDAYPRASAHQLVSSHNDINPSNILYDGQRLWLVDWEAAFANDPHVDPATVAEWFGIEGAADEAMLQTVFGEVDDAVRAQHALMRLVVRTFVACMMLTVTGMSRGPGQAPITNLAGADLADVRVGLRTGAINVGVDEGRIALAKANLKAMVDAVRSPAFTAAVARLAA